MTSCQTRSNTDNAQKLSNDENVDIEKILLAEKTVEYQNDCECIDYEFSEKGNKPLLRHTIGNRKVIVCGYQSKYADNIYLGELQTDSTMYASGFNIFDCSETPLKSIFSEGEFYLALLRIKTEPGVLLVERLISIPIDTTLNYIYTPVTLTEISEQNGKLKENTIFNFPIEIINKEFLDYFKEQIEIAKNDNVNPTKYPDYLIHYMFLKALIYPEKYGKKFKGLNDKYGGFDGYIAVLYRDLLEYYELFENPE